MGGGAQIASLMWEEAVNMGGDMWASQGERPSLGARAGGEQGSCVREGETNEVRGVQGHY